MRPLHTHEVVFKAFGAKLVKPEMEMRQLLILFPDVCRSIASQTSFPGAEQNLHTSLVQEQTSAGTASQPHTNTITRISQRRHRAG